MKHTFVTKAGHDHGGTRYDDGFRPARERARHGAKFDQFTRQASNPHGPQSDDGYRPAGSEVSDDAFEKQLKAVPEHVRGLPLACACGRTYTLEDALRGALRGAGQRATTGKTTRHHDEVDVRKAVREADDAAFGSGCDDLHAALVEQIEKTYGGRIPSSGTVAKTRGSQAAVAKTTTSPQAGAMDAALERVRQIAGQIKT